MEDDDRGDSGIPGCLLIIGGAEDRCDGAPLLERFVELCGGDAARIVLVTTATGQPVARRSRRQTLSARSIRRTASFTRAARRITPHLSTTDHSRTMAVMIDEPKDGL